MKIEQLVLKQRQFFDSGSTIDISYRKAALKKLKAAIILYKKEISEALYKDLKKSEFEAYMAEIGLTLSELNYVIKHLNTWAKDKRVPTPITQFPSKSFTVWEPYGVTLIMSPWNYPFLLCIEPLIGSIAAGNCSILKPSAYSPAVSATIKKMLERIFPRHFVAVVEGGREQNTQLLNQRFDYIFFTGSVNIGKLVMEKASQNLTPVTLELGGKSPCIVDSTADLNLAAKRLVFGKFLNCGQTCVAPDYLLVQKDIKNEFLKYIKKWIIRMLGNSVLKNPDYPKIINEKHFDRLLKLIEGEKIIWGGEYSRDTLQIGPVILDHPAADSAIMQEEIFGPILPVIPFDTMGEVKTFVKNKPKPLALYLFTRNRKTENDIVKSLSFGGGCINDTIIHLATPYMGFGGVGQSGMGSYHGKESFCTFSHRKSIVKKSNRFDIPIRYMPYTKLKKAILHSTLK